MVHPDVAKLLYCCAAVEWSGRVRENATARLNYVFQLEPEPDLPEFIRAA